MQEESDCNYRLIGRQYYGIATRTLLLHNPNPFEDIADTSSEICLCICTREGCPNRESISEVTTEREPTIQELMSGTLPEKVTKIVVSKFPRCPVCMTKYCSRECQVIDHKKGSHSDKCMKYKHVKAHCEKALCKKCWMAKWDALSDFYPQGIRSTAPYKPCRKCYRKEIMLEDSIPDHIASDPDIQRTWLQ